MIMCFNYGTHLSNQTQFDLCLVVEGEFSLAKLVGLFLTRTLKESHFQREFSQARPKWMYLAHILPKLLNGFPRKLVRHL